MSMPVPDGLVFDFDGLLVDTETVVFHGWQQLWREHGLELRLEEWQACVGTCGGFDPLEPFKDWASSRQSELVERHEALADEGVRNLGLRLGVRRLLSDAAALGVPMAVASSSHRAWVERWLGHFGLRACFSAVCTGDEVARVKPHPDLYLLALERLGLPPAGVLAFEDSLNGYTAARRAGLTCVVVPNLVTAGMPFPAECVRLEDLDGGLEAVLARLPGFPDA